jgi:hypothetical protein
MTERTLELMHWASRQEELSRRAEMSTRAHMGMPIFKPVQDVRGEVRVSDLLVTLCAAPMGATCHEHG